MDLLLGTSYVNDFKRLLSDFLVDRKGGTYTDLTVQQNEFEGHMVRESNFAAWDSHYVRAAIITAPTA